MDNPKLILMLAEIRGKTPKDIPPCPFCKSTLVSINVEADQFNYFFVRCAYCHARGSTGVNKADAIKRWARYKNTSD